MLCAALLLALAGASQQPTLTEAPAGFDNLTNGMIDQITHDNDRTSFFEEVDTPANGLGPVYNGTSCAGCHSALVNGVSVDGSSGTTAEHRAGHTDASGNFVNPDVVINGGASVIADRSLINSFATCPQAQETTPSTETIQALRMTVSTLGDGFVEAVPDSTLLAIAQRQAFLTGGLIHGQAIEVPLLEAPGETRIGRFGWKDQHASVLGFAGDAYLNEQGITNRFFPEDVTEVCDSPDVADPEDPPGADGLADIDHFARFIRATKVPPIDLTAASQPDAVAGSRIFDAIGCGTCHTRTMVTAPPGTVMNGGTYTVPDALGNKIIHPFSDFLLHDVGTGDGIVQNGPQSTANKLRTTPLWGLRVRSSTLMHDGKSTSYYSAILRHGGEASLVIMRYKLLTPTQQSQVQKFLGSL